MKDLYEKLFSNSALSALVLSIFLIAIASLGGIPIGTQFQPVDNTGRIALYFVGAILLIMSIFMLLGSQKSANIPKRNSYRITMDIPQASPDEKATLVEFQDTPVSGKFSVKPPIGMFQLFVYDHKRNRYWPQNYQNITWSDGTWAGTVRIGGTGYDVTIVAALIPPSGQVMCDYYFKMGQLTDTLKNKNKDLESNSFNQIYWRHLDGAFPDDFIIIGKVIVRRK